MTGMSRKKVNMAVPMDQRLTMRMERADHRSGNELLAHRNLLTDSRRVPLRNDDHHLE